MTTKFIYALIAGAIFSGLSTAGTGLLCGKFVKDAYAPKLPVGPNGDDEPIPDDVFDVIVGDAQDEPTDE